VPCAPILGECPLAGPGTCVALRSTVSSAPDAFWAISSDELLGRLKTAPSGLSQEEASRRLTEHGPNELREQQLLTRWSVLWAQLRSPLVLLLVFAAFASAATGEWVDATIVIAIVAASAGIGYSREYRAQLAVDALRARAQTRATVLRDGRPTLVPSRDVVPGDVFELAAGSLVPADAVVLDAVDAFVSEAMLTGESFPTEKRAGAVDRSAPLGARTNCVFLGTSVRSGTSRCVAVNTGATTEFGAIAHRLTLRPPETEFDRGIRQFGYLLSTAMLAVILFVLTANVLLGRPALATLLFSIALAVGLSPELLPAILSINLARGAEALAGHGVLVRRLSAIENLGSMDVLCTDKTGTLTEGVVRLEGAYDAEGGRSARVLHEAALNASLQTGLKNPLDEAIVAAADPELGKFEKLAEIPYDFLRKRLSVVVRDASGIRLITKGAFRQVLESCTTLGGRPLDAPQRRALEERYAAWSAQGTRILGLAGRALVEGEECGRAAERDLDFLGFLAFLDRPKDGVGEALEELARLSVSVKLITGDSKLVAQHVARAVGMRADQVLTGQELDELHDEALWHAAEKTDLFVEVDPNQKERIILSLKKLGHVVGFLGDGINDAPAMHAADTSLSVKEAADVAKEAADFVLLERDLSIIRNGIEEGRRTFANTMKYILTTISANLGNMLSMAVASLTLPFLPLLAGQVLLNNFLSDIPAIGLANDSVDRELVERPRRWDLRFITRFMLAFGLLSSVFDFLTFGALLWLFSAGAEVFRTGWFVESLLTELVIALVVRTRRPFFKSRPGTFLIGSSIAIMALTFAIPFLPGAGLLGFVPLPLGMLATLAAITAFYVFATELAKQRFYSPEARDPRIVELPASSVHRVDDQRV
jgi:Mg2+-importing ATPase